MKRPPAEGHYRWWWRRWYLHFSWYQDWKNTARSAVVEVGRDKPAPSPFIRIRVSNHPKRWMPPHNTSVHIEVVNNRFFVVDLTFGGKVFKS